MKNKPSELQKLYLIVLIHRCTFSNQFLHGGNISFEGSLTHKWNKLILYSLEYVHRENGQTSDLNFLA
jgi:hypothetical protein